MDLLARCAECGRPTDVLAAQVRLVASVSAATDSSQLDASVLVTEAVEYLPRTGRTFDRLENWMPAPGRVVPNLRPRVDATREPATWTIRIASGILFRGMEPSALHARKSAALRRIESGAGGSMAGETSAWRANDAARFDLGREAVGNVVALLLDLSRAGTLDTDAAIEEAKRFRRDLLDSGFDRARGPTAHRHRVARY